MTNYLIELQIDDGYQSYTVDENEINEFKDSISKANAGVSCFHQFNEEDGSIIFINLLHVKSATITSTEDGILNPNHLELLNE